MPRPQPTSITPRGSVPPSNGSSAVNHGARGIDGLRVAAIVEVSIVGGRESLACGGPHDVPVQRLICNRNAQSSAPRRLRQRPLRARDRRDGHDFAGDCAEPLRIVRSRPERHRHLTRIGQVDRVDLAGLRQAIRAAVDQFVVRIGLPPFEAGEEIHHVRVAL